MKRVTGIGGVFFKAQNHQSLRQWYRAHLGIPLEDGYFVFDWREKEQPDRVGSTTFSIFRADTEYLSPGRAQFMLNFRVADLDALLETLRAEGVNVLEKIEELEYGRFAWIIDPEGNKIELWEPAAGR